MTAQLGKTNPSYSTAILPRSQHFVLHGSDSWKLQKSPIIMAFEKVTLSFCVSFENVQFISHPIRDQKWKRTFKDRSSSKLCLSRSLYEMWQSDSNETEHDHPNLAGFKRPELCFWLHSLWPWPAVNNNSYNIFLTEYPFEIFWVSEEFLENWSWNYLPFLDAGEQPSGWMILLNDKFWKSLLLTLHITSVCRTLRKCTPVKFSDDPF